MERGHIWRHIALREKKKLQIGHLATMWAGCWKVMCAFFSNEDISSRQGRGWVRTYPLIPRGAMGKTQREMLPAGLPCGRCQLCAPLQKKRARKRYRTESGGKKIIMNWNSNISGSAECVATVPFVVEPFSFFFFSALSSARSSPLKCWRRVSATCMQKYFAVV